jgi:hypothetical protein
MESAAVEALLLESSRLIASAEFVLLHGSLSKRIENLSGPELFDLYLSAMVDVMVNGGSTPGQAKAYLVHRLMNIKSGLLTT